MNKLQFESSPYLLQHKNNPVDWYPWGKEALDRALQEDKPILLSIGYSSCHWCHVMEHESFNDPKVADLMNSLFVCIKLDREERPDLDKLYMDGVQAISGSGGWPLNCFLLPDKRLYYGGTYFPPIAAHQRPSWSQVVDFAARLFKDRRKDIEEQAARLMSHASGTANTLKEVAIKFKSDLTAKEKRKQLFSNIKSRFDTTHGGFGTAPKFPSPMSLSFLLDYYFFTGESSALDHVHLTLYNMARQGIYDQVGGGFARYATDTAWKVPHFEKMLYDNAQLLGLYSHLFQLKPHPLYKNVVEATFQWLNREMLSEHGLYYCAQDADSEGVEGKFYTWSLDELKECLLPAEVELCLQVFEILPEGNWNDPHGHSEQGKNILWWNDKMDDAGIFLSLEFQHILNKLLHRRRQRVAPLTDTKMLTSWNALLAIGLLKAYHTFEDEVYLGTAKSILDALCKYTMDTPVKLHQIGSSIPAMLDDVSFYTQACLMYYYTTGDTIFLNRAEQTMLHIMSVYFDPSTSSFKYSVIKDDLGVAEVQDVYDSIMPSATGTTVGNLIHLGRLLDRMDWESVGNRILLDMEGAILRYTESLAYWGSLSMLQQVGNLELKIGSGINRSDLLKIPGPTFILKEADENPPHSIGLCHNFICEMVVYSAKDLRLLMNKQYSISVH